MSPTASRRSHPRVRSNTAYPVSRRCGLLLPLPVSLSLFGGSCGLGLSAGEAVGPLGNRTAGTPPVPVSGSRRVLRVRPLRTVPLVSPTANLPVCADAPRCSSNGRAGGPFRRRTRHRRRGGLPAAVQRRPRERPRGRHERGARDHRPVPVGARPVVGRGADPGADQRPLGDGRGEALVPRGLGTTAVSRPLNGLLRGGANATSVESDPTASTATARIRRSRWPASGSAGRARTRRWRR